MIACPEPRRVNSQRQLRTGDSYLDSGDSQKGFPYVGKKHVSLEVFQRAHLFFYALAVAMIGIGVAVEPFEQLFNFSYLFFTGALIWAVGWWLTSEPLERKKPKADQKVEET